MIEKFGINERGLTNSEWLEVVKSIIQIGKKMKTDNHIRLRTIRYVAEADQYLCY